MSATSLLLLQLIVILGIARVCGWLLRHVGQPAVVGEMEARVVLGPIVLGGLFQTLFGGAVDTQLAPAYSQCRIKPAECRARRGHRPGPPARKRAFEFPIPSGHSEILASGPPAGLDDARQPLPARIMFSGPNNRPSSDYRAGIAMRWNRGRIFRCYEYKTVETACRGSQGLRRHHLVPTVRQKLSFSLLAMASLTAPSVGRRRTIHKSQSGVRSAVRIRFP